MFKVADKMAGVCLWVGPSGSIPGPDWNVRPTPRTEPQQNFATQNVTHIHTCILHIHRFTKNRWKTDMQFIFFLQSKK